jgi:hypothetical protein
MNKMINDLTKFHCIKHCELLYIIRNTHRTKKVVQTKLEKKLTIRIDQHSKFYPASFIILSLLGKQKLTTPYRGIIFGQGMIGPSYQNVTSVPDSLWRRNIRFEKRNGIISHSLRYFVYLILFQNLRRSANTNEHSEYRRMQKHKERIWKDCTSDNGTSLHYHGNSYVRQ